MRRMNMALLMVVLLFGYANAYELDNWTLTGTGGNDSRTATLTSRNSTTVSGLNDDLVRFDVFCPSMMGSNVLYFNLHANWKGFPLKGEFVYFDYMDKDRNVVKQRVEAQRPNNDVIHFNIPLADIPWIISDGLAPFITVETRHGTNGVSYYLGERNVIKRVLIGHLNCGI